MGFSLKTTQLLGYPHDYGNSTLLYHLQQIHIFRWSSGTCTGALRAPPHCSSPWSRSSNASWTPSVASTSENYADGWMQWKIVVLSVLSLLFAVFFTWCLGDGCESESIPRHHVTQFTHDFIREIPSKLGSSGTQRVRDTDHCSRSHDQLASHTCTRGSENPVAGRDEKFLLTTQIWIGI